MDPKQTIKKNLSRRSEKVDVAITHNDIPIPRDQIVIMFRGLQIEKALWSTLGDILDNSGWTDAPAT